MTTRAIRVDDEVYRTLMSMRRPTEPLIETVWRVVFTAERPRREPAVACPYCGLEPGELPELSEIVQT